MIFATGRQLPVLMLGQMYSTTVAGFYAMAFRLVFAPVDVLASSVRRTCSVPRSAQHSGDATAFLLGSTLAAIGVLPTLCLAFFGESLSTWFLGERWTSAGRYLEIITGAVHAADHCS
jgi:O-antigen/teichoic acid export membrane protein